MNKNRRSTIPLLAGATRPRKSVMGAFGVAIEILATTIRTNTHSPADVAGIHDAVDASI